MRIVVRFDWQRDFRLPLDDGRRHHDFRVLGDEVAAVVDHKVAVVFGGDRCIRARFRCCFHRGSLAGLLSTLFAALATLTTAAAAASAATAALAFAMLARRALLALLLDILL